MPHFTINNKNILFIHIPKTGGTSVLDTFNPLAEFKEGWMSRPNNKNTPINHYHHEWLRDRYDFSSFDFIFAVVRHPVRRLESDFKFLTSHHSRLPKNINEYIPFVFEKYSENPFIFDNHIRPQSHFIKDSRVQVFKFEQGVSNILRHINNELNLNLPTNKHSNRSRKTHDPITQENLELIYDFYSEDFERFDYEKIS